MSSAVRALEAEQGSTIFGPARLHRAGVVPDADAVDREGSSGRGREKGKQRAESVSVVFLIGFQDWLTIYLVPEMHSTGSGMCIGAG